MVPLVQATFNFGGPWGYPYNAMMNCKDLNASGLFNSKLVPTKELANGHNMMLYMCIIVHAIHCYQTLISASSFNRPEHNRGTTAACTARDACHARSDTVVCV